MRLNVLNHGYSFRTRLLFKAVHLFSHQPVPDAGMTYYRPDFYGSASKVPARAAMRGPSSWSVAERELMAAYVSKRTTARSASAPSPRRPRSASN